MTDLAQQRDQRRWKRGGALAFLMAFAMVIAALPGVASAGSSSSAHLTSPLGQTLTSPTQTFTWSTGTGVSAYWLYVGTTTGSPNIYNSGQLPATQQSATATNLPANGSTLHVRLWSLIGGTWQYNDYSFAAAQPVIAQLTSPTPNSILPATIVTFQWTSVPNQGLWLYVGSAPGASDYCNSGPMPPIATSFICSTLPNDASTVYVRLWTDVGTPDHSVWLYRDYRFTAAGAIIPVLAPLGDLAGSVCAPLATLLPLVNVSATNATAVYISTGTTGPGSTNLLGTTSVPTPVFGLFLGGTTCPAVGDSVTIYVRLTYTFGPITYHDDYTFTLTASV